jgi:hypothetical protein
LREFDRLFSVALAPERPTQAWEKCQSWRGKVDDPADRCRLTPVKAMKCLKWLHHQPQKCMTTWFNMFLSRFMRVATALQQARPLALQFE